MSATAIEHRLARRRLHRIHASVYALALPLLPLARYMAAVLACGAGAAASHRAAAAVLDLRPPPSGPIDVLVQRSGGRRRRGIALHTTRSLSPQDVTVRNQIPCTSPARTLVDLAGLLSHRQLRRAVERSETLGLFDLTAVEDALDRARGRRGARALRQLVAELYEPAPAWSELERRFLELVEHARVRHPKVNEPIGTVVVDFHWPEQKLVIETDGRKTHDTADAFERDRQQELQLALAGWQVVRIGWRQVVGDPRRVVEMLRLRLPPR